MYVILWASIVWFLWWMAWVLWRKILWCQLYKSILEEILNSWSSYKKDGFFLCRFAGSRHPDERCRSWLEVHPHTAYRKDENEALQREDNSGEGILFQFNAGIHSILQWFCLFIILDLDSNPSGNNLFNHHCLLLHLPTRCWDNCRLVLRFVELEVAGMLQPRLYTGRRRRDIPLCWHLSRNEKEMQLSC